MLTSADPILSQILKTRVASEEELLNGSLNTLLSSLFLTRQGAFVDAFALLLQPLGDSPLQRFRLTTISVGKG